MIYPKKDFINIRIHLVSYDQIFDFNLNRTFFARLTLIHIYLKVK